MNRDDVFDGEKVALMPTHSSFEVLLCDRTITIFKITFIVTRD